MHYIYIHIYIVLYINYFTGKVYIYIYKVFIWRLPFLRNLGTSSHAALFPRKLPNTWMTDILNKIIIGRKGFNRIQACSAFENPCG